ncbi:MAG: hypothetical protein CL489_03255 [Acidobacteria bacterium]|nr:hypothetical protein [Acidobacteriota bacterium]|tara:strand:- start:1207 stop:1428 length:222 start_codon:yes stop_codon:yes gene_type:complete
MRLKQAINEQVAMCDLILQALRDGAGYWDEYPDMVEFMEETRHRLRVEGNMLDDGTHPILNPPTGAFPLGSIR